jgi:hypothetical protein
MRKISRAGATTLHQSDRTHANCGTGLDHKSSAITPPSEIFIFAHGDSYLHSSTPLSKNTVTDPTAQSLTPHRRAACGSPYGFAAGDLS